MTKPKPGLVEAGHPIERLAHELSGSAFEIAAAYKMSRWELCLALANACGQILADSKDMPRDAAIERMDGLRTCMQGAYDLRNVDGTG